VNRFMSFQDPWQGQRSSRYSAFAQPEDGYPPYQQRPPWDELFENDLARPTGRHSGAQRSLLDTGPHREPPRRASGGFHAATRTDQARRYRPRSSTPRRTRGLLPGAIAGFLAAAVALGTANLVAAFVRPQASPIIAVGGAFIDRTPPALKNFAVDKFGENDKNVLLLGMYATIALIAIVIGMLAWRRVAIGVAGIGMFGLFGAFVAITRPESHVTDVIPSIVGGIAGIVAIVYLVRAGMSAGMPAPVQRRRSPARWAGGDV
jgi:hypothetical protein